MIQADIRAAAVQWLQRFETGLSTDGSLVATLFQADCHWRDVLALTWRIETVSGRDAVVQALGARDRTPSRLAVDPGRTAPREVMRAGARTIEAIFSFETADGLGDGVVRLTPD